MRRLDGSSGWYFTASLRILEICDVWMYDIISLYRSGFIFAGSIFLHQMISGVQHRMWCSARITGPKLPKMQCNMGQIDSKTSRSSKDTACPSISRLYCHRGVGRARYSSGTKKTPPASSTQVVAAKPLWPHEGGFSVTLPLKVPP